jgi:hypothetical protein
LPFGAAIRMLIHLKSCVSEVSLLNIRQLPSSLKEGLCRSVDTELGKSVPASNSRYPALFSSLGWFRPKIEIHGAVTVFRPCMGVAFISPRLEAFLEILFDVKDLREPYGSH